MKRKGGMNTTLVHGGELTDQFGSAVVPIYQTSTFRFVDAQQGARLFAGQEEGYIYTRISNPTIRVFEQKMAMIEGGVDGIATASGMAAVSTVYLGMLSAGDHIISTAAVYGSSRTIMENHFSRFGVESTYINTADIRNIERSIRSNTKLIFIETPTNPTMELTDLEAVVRLARRNNLKVVVDNTFATPILQRPLEWGVDVVVHSLTKYINGHADVVGGVIVVNDKALADTLRMIMIGFGMNMDPHQAFMVYRGMKTLELRVLKAQQNAQIIAEFLEKHEKISKVYYPGLPSHPQYELAKKQMLGPGSMISFELKGGYEACVRLLNEVKLALLAVSLGGVETLIQHPASMTHSAIAPEKRLEAGITDGLIRLSIGIEDVEDIIDDLKQALEKI